MSSSLLHADLTRDIIAAFYDVYNELGSGFLESCYVRALQLELARRGVESRREVPAEVRFRGEVVGLCRLDLLVADAVIVECKTADRLAVHHESQLLHYLKATGITVGLILFFGSRPLHRRLVRSGASPQR